MELRNITFGYADKLILKDFSMSFPQKGIVTIFGPSGCGKSTILNLLCGLYRPFSGEVLCADRIGYVFQEDRLLPWFSIRKNIQAVNDKKDPTDAMRLMGLLDFAEKMPKEISGGMKQRAALARGVHFDANISFLDEPFKGIDFKGKSRLMDIYKEMAKDKLFVLVTHDKHEASYLSDIVYKVEGNPLEITDTVYRQGSDDMRIVLL